MHTHTHTRKQNRHGIAKKVSMRRRRRRTGAQWYKYNVCPLGHFVFPANIIFFLIVFGLLFCLWICIFRDGFHLSSMLGQLVATSSPHSRVLFLFAIFFFFLSIFQLNVVHKNGIVDGDNKHFLYARNTMQYKTKLFVCWKREGVRIGWCRWIVYLFFTISCFHYVWHAESRNSVVFFLYWGHTSVRYVQYIWMFIDNITLLLLKVCARDVRPTIVRIIRIVQFFVVVCLVCIFRSICRRYLPLAIATYSFWLLSRYEITG